MYTTYYIIIYIDTYCPVFIYNVNIRSFIVQLQFRTLHPICHFFGSAHLLRLNENGRMPQGFSISARWAPTNSIKGAITLHIGALTYNPICNW